MPDRIDYVPEYVRNLEAALAFYADPVNWESVEIEKISDVLSSWTSGPAVDGGERARRALAYAEGHGPGSTQWEAECAEFGCHDA